MVNLQYKYAQLDETTLQCVGCFTCTYEIPLWNYIEVEDLSLGYEDKYYNYNGDKLWYEDAEFTILAEGLN